MWCLALCGNGFEEVFIALADSKYKLWNDSKVCYSLLYLHIKVKFKWKYTYAPFYVTENKTVIVNISSFESHISSSEPSLMLPSQGCCFSINICVNIIINQ